MKHPHHSCAANALRTLATMDVADSRLELAEIQFGISIVDRHASQDAQACPYCKALYPLIEVSVDEFGAPQRPELFAPRLMRPAVAECVGEAWPSELDPWGGWPEGARVLMENLVQAPIVMGRVRMELAEVVWRGWVVEMDRLNWRSREDSQLGVSP